MRGVRYLDHHATTPVDPSVVAAMLPFLTEHFGNPGSPHAYGWAAEEAVEIARERVAALLGASPREVVFTSGATEANDLAIRGVLTAYAARGRHVISAPTEHKAVRDLLRHLSDAGACEVTWLPVDGGGRVTAEAVEAALRPDTVLVTLMHANNEVGTLHPIAAIGAVCKAAGVLLHTDGAQAVGKIPVAVDALQVDLLSLSAHKLYGPKGVGALYVRRRHPQVRLTPQLIGGGQERGRRAGTLPVHQIVGLGAAAALAQGDLADEASRLAALRDRLQAGLLAQVPGLRVNGDVAHRLPHNLNVSVPGVPGDALLTSLRGLALSTGSACAAGDRAPSHVLRAMGLSDALAHASLRFGLGRGTTEDDIDAAIAEVTAAAAALRAETGWLAPASQPGVSC